MVEVVCGVRTGVGVGGAGVVINGGNVSVAGEEARWRDCWSFSDGIFGKVWKDFP